MRLVSDDAWAIMNIWIEARGEPYEGRVAVGRVMRNRMRLKFFSDGTVSNTVLYPYQFSGWNSSGHGRDGAAKLVFDRLPERGHVPSDRAAEEA